MINQSILEKLTDNQAKLIAALSENQAGLLSRELASKTGVSNKSGTITPELKSILAANNLELRIEKHANGGNQALWSLHSITPNHDDEKFSEILACFFEDLAVDIRLHYAEPFFLLEHLEECVHVLIENIIDIRVKEMQNV
jgi:hypothetical protein